MIHYHGTPITPRPELLTLAGRNFCVSFAKPQDVKVCHEIGQSVMLDNGAFTFWRNGGLPAWARYMDWAEEWLDFQTTWAVIPDVIDGSEQENDALLVMWFQRRMERGAPVWHLHESLDRLRRLAHGYERICFGSSGAYRTGEHYPFASVDSTDVARNHYLPHNSAVKLANRWDGLQTPGRWQRVEQLELEEAV